MPLQELTTTLITEQISNFGHRIVDNLKQLSSSEPVNERYAQNLYKEILRYRRSSQALRFNERVRLVPVENHPDIPWFIKYPEQDFAEAVTEAEVINWLYTAFDTSRHADLDQKLVLKNKHRLNQLRSHVRHKDRGLGFMAARSFKPTISDNDIFLRLHAGSSYLILTPEERSYLNDEMNQSLTKHDTAEDRKRGSRPASISPEAWDIHIHNVMNTPLGGNN